MIGFVFMAMALVAGVASAQSDPLEIGQGPESAGKARSREAPRTIAAVLKDSDRIDGLLTLYRDRKSGELHLALTAAEFDKPYLYFLYTENGIPAARHISGNYDLERGKLFRLRRFYDRVEVVIENTNFSYDPAKAIARAAQTNISHAVASVHPIEAEDPATGRIVINVSGLFLSEAFHPIAPLPDPKRKPHEEFSLGQLDMAKSKILKVRNYPANTDVIVEYVYENKQPYVNGGDEVTDPRFVSLTMQHSIVAAPDDGFKPRYDDPRVGYITGKATDLSSTAVTPYRDVITRWRLEKKDPSAAVSEPVEPIVFWIENTTPVELRPTIEQATLRWNEAFESAGFRNAIVVHTQPDDADWDAGDLRYNVIRWVSSPAPQYGGFGPSFFDPRTGQILGADIVLEYWMIGRTLHESRVFGAEPPESEGAGHSVRCTAAQYARQGLQFASTALETFGVVEKEQERLLQEFLYWTVLHEVGHVLGLPHNFQGSQLHSFEALFDPAQTYPVGLIDSVMDYPGVPLALPGHPQGQFYTTRPGPYDHWAITYGYSQALADPGAEAERLQRILARSSEPALAFGGDGDIMLWTPKGIDPRVMSEDLSSDPIRFAAHTMEVVDAVVPRLGERLLREGGSYQELVNGYQAAVERYGHAATVASRFIGGVYVDRSMVGQPGAGVPLKPVSLEDQRRAMKLLRDRLFAPDAFAGLSGVANRLLPQRRGDDLYHSRQTVDPKIHALVLKMQQEPLDHLLRPLVLARVTDTALYGNRYSVAALLTDLTDAVFAADLDGGVNTFRQNLQLDYVRRLLAMVRPAQDNPYDSVSKVMALDRLRWIEAQLKRHRGGDAATAAHRAHILYRIKRGLDPAQEQ